MLQHMEMQETSEDTIEEPAKYGIAKWEVWQ